MNAIMNFVGDSVEMEPNIARNLFKNGATLIVAGVPVGTEFGIDLSSYEVGDRFRGVKMIPPGPHYVFCAARDTYGGVAPRVGFVHYFKPSEIVVREWNAQTEELRLRQCQDQELEMRRIRENLMDLDRFLAPYDFEGLSKWKFLTDTITAETISRCIPKTGFIKNSMEYLSCPDSERPRGRTTANYKYSQLACDENDLLPNLKPLPDTALNFTEIPPRIPKDATPSQITQHHMDCVEGVENYFSRFAAPIDAIPELQLQFVFFCAGYSVDGLSCWRRVLNLVSNSETAVSKFKLFYMKYLEVLQHQLPELPDELMEQTANNTVCKDIRSILQNCTLGGLGVSADRLAKNLQKTMKWTFVGLLDEDPDDMPVIVDDVE